MESQKLWMFLRWVVAQDMQVWKVYLIYYRFKSFERHNRNKMKTFFTANTGVVWLIYPEILMMGFREKSDGFETWMFSIGTQGFAKSFNN